MNSAFYNYYAMISRQKMYYGSVLNAVTFDLTLYLSHFYENKII